MIFLCCLCRLLRSESPSGKVKREKLCTMAASNNRDHTPRSLYYCLFAPRIYIVFLFVHIPFELNCAFQCNASGVVATRLIVILIASSYTKAKKKSRTTPKEGDKYSRPTSRAGTRWLGPPRAWTLAPQLYNTLHLTHK